jgi:NADH:ubiquinone oxidoreductase subunit H
MLTTFINPFYGPFELFSLQPGLLTTSTGLSVFSSADFFTLWNPGTETGSTSTLLIKDLLLGFVRIVLVLIGVAYFTLAERKIMASVQRRRGPNVVGLFGLLQPLADGLKLLCKEMIIPSKSNTVVFLIAPLAIIILSLVGWAVIPFSPSPSLSPITETPGWFINTIAAAILTTGHNLPTNE